MEEHKELLGSYEKKERLEAQKLALSPIDFGGTCNLTLDEGCACSDCEELRKIVGLPSVFKKGDYDGKVKI